VDELALGYRIILGYPADLPVCGLRASLHNLQSFATPLHRTETKAGRDPLLDKAMILLDNVVQIRHCSALVQTGLSNKLALVMRWAGLCLIEGPQRESSGKRRVPQFRHRRFPFPERPRLELTLLDPLPQLDSANGDCRVVESFESQHRPNPLFDAAVVLFDEIVQVLGSIALLLDVEVRRSPSSPALRDVTPRRRLV
jgi:hypothetical protein